MRVAVIGTSGSGKTTFARRLAASTGVPHIELDAINWQAGWRDLHTHDPDELRRRVSEAVAKPAWISDGNYSKIRDLVLARATHVVWLDYSRLLTMRRVIWRSLLRAATKAEIWPGTGNTEAFRSWLKHDHPIRWAWTTHARHRREYARLLEGSQLAEAERIHVRRPQDLRGVEIRLKLAATAHARRFGRRTSAAGPAVQTGS